MTSSYPGKSLDRTDSVFVPGTGVPIQVIEWTEMTSSSYQGNGVDRTEGVIVSRHQGGQFIQMTSL
jgi:hypothetical protein